MVHGMPAWRVELKLGRRELFQRRLRPGGQLVLKEVGLRGEQTGSEDRDSNQLRQEPPTLASQKDHEAHARIDGRHCAMERQGAPGVPAPVRRKPQIRTWPMPVVGLGAFIVIWVGRVELGRALVAVDGDHALGEDAAGRSW